MRSASSGLRHPASASCLGRHSRLAGRCPNNSSLFPPLAAVVVAAERLFIISEYRSVCGRSGIPFSREGFGTNSLSQSLTALPAPSGREPLARPGTLHFRRKLYRHAKCPIPEDDFPRPMPDSPKGEYPFRLAAARQATFPKGTAFRGGGTVPG